MTSKKYKLSLLAVLLITATASFAQTGAGFTAYGNDVIPEKRMPQQNDFNNGTYNYPAKPRNQVEVGVSLGLMNVSGDVPSKAFTAPNFAVHVRKALGYLFSLRLQYVNGKAEGMHWLASENYFKNTAWTSNGYQAARRIPGNPDRTIPNRHLVYYNYRANISDASLQGLVNFNNVRFHKKKTGLSFYGGGGLGATWYKTYVNALNGTANYTTLMNNVAFQSLANGTYGRHADRKKILDQLKAGMDKTYETPAEGHKARRPGSGDGIRNTLKPSGTVILGVQFKLAKNLALALEDRHTFIKDDLLDGQRWQEHAWGDAVLTRDFDSWNYLSLGLNLSLGNKSVEPLWWLNPLDYAYSEIRNPNNVRVKMECDDADNDGVCDFLDKEPNTPAGCPVDTHGVTKDTDGDGVADCKDKQLITPTECQPVDADGIGKCPDPKCCTEGGGGKIPSKDCPCDYPSVGFRSGSSTLSADAKAMLDQVASKLDANGSCSITIVGHSATSKSAQELCNKRRDAIVRYLTEVKGISADRITADCQMDGGSINTFDIKCN